MNLRRAASEASHRGPGPSAPGGGRGRQPPAAAHPPGAPTPTAVTAPTPSQPSPGAPSPATPPAGTDSCLSRANVAETEQFDDVTAEETAPDENDDHEPVPVRDVQLLDFRDGPTVVAVTHGPLDPSRIWLELRSDVTILSLSVEEGLARQLASGLADVLRNFNAVRSSLR